MPFTLRWLEESRTAYDQLKSRAEASRRHRLKNKSAKSSPDEGLFKQVHKSLALLADNPRHPGLNTHKFDSLPHPYHPHQKVFEAYAQNRTPAAYRIFWCYGPAARDHHPRHHPPPLTPVLRLSSLVFRFSSLPSPPANPYHPLAKHPTPTNH